MQRNARVKVSVLCPGPVNTDILNASRRNLPESVPLPADITPEEAVFKKAYEIYIAQGLEPEEVGQKVLEAIREEQFYVITHDYSSAIETRMRNILAGQNPEPQPPTAEFLKIVETLIGK
jgi:short-subunit dehydrogenase